ncbi:hypothetical protein [Aequorivita marina]|uniref:hypothetical protein n=1 Tax=Aequorivita marina TaxID=3073654 RepID=UPI002875FF7B|nr:hypothetical protein [Aequorivita sp. S2608]MDS1297107.1 hypothetical protein [Aequorivita sp. S2608]
MILICVVVFATSLTSYATTPTFKSDVAVDCMSEAMRRADIDLANGTITPDQYFGRVNYYKSQCAIAPN